MNWAVDAINVVPTVFLSYGNEYTQPQFVVSPDILLVYQHGSFVICVYKDVEMVGMHIKFS